MARQALRRIERPATHRARDGIILGLILAMFVLAVIGLASLIAFFAGGRLVGSAGPPHTGGDPVALSLSRAHRRARIIVRRAESRARSERVAILVQARTEATDLIARARRQADKIHRSSAGGPGNRFVAPTAVPTSPSVQPTLAPPVAVPRATSGGSGFPNLGGVPGGWAVVAYGAEPTTGTVDIANRSGRAFSGVVSLTFYSRTGKPLQSRSGIFSDLAPHSLGSVVLGPPAVGWYRYRVGMSNVH